MSKWTHLRRLLAVLAVFLMFFSVLSERGGLNSAMAGPVSDAQEQLNKAYNDYYDALSTGGRKTPEEQKALKQKIVDPAMSSLSQAMKQEADEIAKRNAQNFPSTRAGAGGSESASSTSSTPAVRETQPEVTLDAADIPKELEFPGRPVKPQPSPSASQGAYAGPFAPKSR